MHVMTTILGACAYGLQVPDAYGARLPFKLMSQVELTCAMDSSTDSAAYTVMISNLPSTAAGILIEVRQGFEVRRAGGIFQLWHSLQ